MATATKAQKNKPKSAKKQAANSARVATTEPKVKSAGAKAARGRPSKYSPELARQICLRIAAGESTRAIAKDESMPSEATIRAWAVDDLEGFSAQYTRAIQIRAIGWSEEIVDISDDGANDTYIDNNGNARTDHDVIARSRLRVDTRKWMLSKMLPKVYGDKVDLNHGVKPEDPLASLIQRIAGTGLPVVKDIPDDDDD